MLKPWKLFATKSTQVDTRIYYPIFFDSVIIMDSAEVCEYVAKYTGDSVVDTYAEIAKNQLNENRNFMIGLAAILGISLSALYLLFRQSQASSRDPFPDDPDKGQLPANPELITIHCIKFRYPGDDTDFSSPNYYKRDENKDKKTFVLTNGANDTLSPQGGGTTAAIRIINPKLFDNPQLKFNPMDTLGEFHNRGLIERTINKKNQKITVNKTEYPAGSVFFVESTVPESGGNEPKNKVRGVYHIKGINYNNMEIGRGPTEYLVRELVKAYYTAILEDFSKRTEDVLCLAQVPGSLYGGTENTLNAMLTAVLDFQKNYKVGRRPFQINIDAESPNLVPVPVPEQLGGIDFSFDFKITLIIVLIILLVVLLLDCFNFIRLTGDMVIGALTS